MNAISLVQLPRVQHDMDYAAALAVLADVKLGEAAEYLAQWTEAHFADPDRPRGQWERVRDAQVALQHARSLIEPLMVERQP